MFPPAVTSAARRKTSVEPSKASQVVPESFKRLSHHSFNIYVRRGKAACIGRTYLLSIFSATNSEARAAVTNNAETRTTVARESSVLGANRILVLSLVNSDCFKR